MSTVVGRGNLPSGMTLHKAKGDNAQFGDQIRQSTGRSGPEVYDSDFRELFAFPDADSAVRFVAGIRQAVSQCPYDTSTGREYALTTRPVTGYAKVTSTEHGATDPNFPIAVVWHVLRVG